MRLSTVLLRRKLRCLQQRFIIRPPRLGLLSRPYPLLLLSSLRAHFSLPPPLDRMDLSWVAPLPLPMSRSLRPPHVLRVLSTRLALSSREYLLLIFLSRSRHRLQHIFPILSTRVALLIWAHLLLILQSSPHHRPRRTVTVPAHRVILVLWACLLLTFKSRPQCRLHHIFSVPATRVAL